MILKHYPFLISLLYSLTRPLAPILALSLLASYSSIMFGYLLWAFTPPISSAWNNLHQGICIHIFLTAFMILFNVTHWKQSTLTSALPLTLRILSSWPSPWPRITFRNSLMYIIYLLSLQIVLLLLTLD